MTTQQDAGNLTRCHHHLIDTSRRIYDLKLRIEKMSPGEERDALAGLAEAAHTQLGGALEALDAFIPGGCPDE